MRTKYKRYSDEASLHIHACILGEHSCGGDRNRPCEKLWGMCHQREWTDGGGDEGSGAGTDTGVSPDDALTAVTDAVSEGGRSGG